ncbi:hypothetical protein D3C86_1388590 [compost metagenome]
MPHIIHRIGIKAPIYKVYEAVASIEGISGWWTKDTTGESAIGKTIRTRFHTQEGEEQGSMEIEVLDLQPGKKVHWKFHAGPPEWIGTEVTFEFKQEENYTIILFSHLNWQEEVEFKAHCSMKWAVFLLRLRQLIETSKGNPAPHDFKIDNWN